MSRELLSVLPKISRREDIGMIDLRGLASDKAFFSAVEKCLGFSLPTTPRCSAKKGQIYCLWLSVDQWLIICPEKRRDKIYSSLRSALKGVHAMVTDMSCARVVFRLSGAGSVEVLQKGTSVDLADVEVGFVRRALISEVACLIHIVSAVPEIDVYVFRSYGDYLEQWFERSLSGGVFKIF